MALEVFNLEGILHTGWLELARFASLQFMNDR